MATIQGLDKLNKQLASLANVNPHALLASAFVLQAAAQALAPVKTGFLRANAISRQTEAGAEVEFSANYAAYVEMGTSVWAGHPFVRPAIDAHSDDIVKTAAIQIDRDMKAKLE